MNYNDYEQLNKRLNELEYITKKSRVDVNKIYDHNGNLISTKYFYHGKLHRDENYGPAIFNQYPEGKICEEYYKYGKIHREKGPAYIYRTNYLNHMLEWYYEGKKHREGDEPAEISFFNDLDYPLISSEKYYKHKKRHRDGDKPAVIWYNLTPENNHYIKCESWYYDDFPMKRPGDKPNEIFYFPDGRPRHLGWKNPTDKYHNSYHRDDDLPAGIDYHIENDVYYKSSEFYKKNGKLHREKGPAIIDYYSNGNVKKEIYYKNDNQIGFENFYNIEGKIIPYPAPAAENNYDSDEDFSDEDLDYYSD